MFQRKEILVVDDLVRTDGPIAAALRTIHGNSDSKDLADRSLKLPASEVIRRFTNAPTYAPKTEIEKLFQECFYSGFPDISEWVPPDIPEALPSWLTDSPDTQYQKMSQQVQGLPLDSRLGHSSSGQLAVGAGLCGNMAKPSETFCSQAQVTHDVARLAVSAENKFALNLINTLAMLGRKTNCVCTHNPPLSDEMHRDEIISSLVDVPHGFIVPGGRFREMYYWCVWNCVSELELQHVQMGNTVGEICTHPGRMRGALMACRDSYWTIRGLLYCGMICTARGMILNFADLVRRFGFIPNGTRSYYLDRSQPPVFSMMLALYFTFTGDLELIKETYLDVEREYMYWTKGSGRRICVLVDGKKYYLNRYVGHCSTPRPESWKEDVLVARCVADRARSASDLSPEEAHMNILRNIRAAAESGWDFSSRWVPDDIDATKNWVMTNLKTESFLPVDLNSFLYHAELYLFHFGQALKKLDVGLRNNQRSRPPKFFQHCAESRREAMLKLLWNDEVNWWFDFDISRNRQSARVTAAGVVPFFMQLHSSIDHQIFRLFSSERNDSAVVNTASMCAEGAAAHHTVDVAAQGRQLWTARFLVEKSGLWNTYGISTTQLQTRQQWDGSNCWPPLLQMAIEAMIDLEDSTALKAVKGMADRHILSCMQAYRRLGALPEKSSSLFPGSCGSGGEYDCQKGFGWSIGVVLELLFFKRKAFLFPAIRKLRREFGCAAFLKWSNTKS